MRDTAEARAFAFGYVGEPSRPAVTAHLDFIHRPTARNWYRAHNASIVAGYLDNEARRREGRVERFFINVFSFGCCSHMRWWPTTAGIGLACAVGRRWVIHASA